MILTLSTVNSILRTEDIEGLIALGAPANEYSMEAKEIQSRLGGLDADQWTTAQVSALVWDVWLRAFGPFLPNDIQKRQPVLEQLVRRIMDERFVTTIPAKAQTASNDRVH